MIETRRGFLEFATAACIGSALPLRGYSAHEIQPDQLRFGVN